MLSFRALLMSQELPCCSASLPSRSQFLSKKNHRDQQLLLLLVLLLLCLCPSLDLAKQTPPLLWSPSLPPVCHRCLPLGPSGPPTAPFLLSEVCLAGTNQVGMEAWLLSGWEHILLSQGGDFVFLGLLNLIGIGNGASVLSV